MQNDCLDNGTDEHQDGDRETLVWAGTVCDQAMSCILIVGDKRQKPSQQLRLEKREAISYKFQKCGECERSAICDEERGIQ